MTTIGSVADVQVHWNGPEVERQVQNSIALGLKAGAKFLSSRVRELLSVPAPRTRATSRKMGVIYYRATIKATAGAPPRKLSGRFRTTVTDEINSEGDTARVGSNAIQSRRLEKGWPEGHAVHAYLAPTLNAQRDNLAAIIGHQ